MVTEKECSIRRWKGIRTLSIIVVPLILGVIGWAFAQGEKENEQNQRILECGQEVIKSNEIMRRVEIKVDKVEKKVDNLDKTQDTIMLMQREITVKLDQVLEDI